MPPTAGSQCPIGERLASRDREGMRFEFKVPHAEEPFAHSGVVDDELLLGMVKLLLLNSALQLDTYSAVVALPGAPAGSWHSDVEDPFAFHAAIVGGRSHAPPPGLVVVVPLVDVDETLGPTAFRLGSHVKSDGGMWDRGEGDNAAAFPELSLPARRGTVVLFDLRLEHRGGANRATVKRPILYLGYTNRWCGALIVPRVAPFSRSMHSSAHQPAWTVMHQVPRRVQLQGVAQRGVGRAVQPHAPRAVRAPRFAGARCVVEAIALHSALRLRTFLWSVHWVCSGSSRRPGHPKPNPNQEYVQRLERELKARGGDLAALKAADAPDGSDEGDQAHNLII